MDNLRDHLDPQRVVRAASVKVFSQSPDGEQLPSNHYCSPGSKELYYLHTQPHFSCDCPDFVMRDKVCKHLIKALLVEGDPIVVSFVQGLGVDHFFKFQNKE